MNNLVNLLLCPTQNTLKLEDYEKSLAPHWARVFVDNGLLTAEHFTQMVDGKPVWLTWLEDNNEPQQASEVVVDVLGEAFDWMQPLAPNHPEQLRVDAVFPYCSLAALDRVFSRLSPTVITSLRSRTGDGVVSLQYALNEQENDLVAGLAKWGWDIEDPDQSGQTWLLRAERWGAAQLLLQNGANVFAVDHNQKTVLDRVKKWTREGYTSAEITKIIHTYLNTSKTADPLAAKKIAALSTLFADIGSEKTGSVVKALTTLQKLNTDRSDVVDVAGRSLMQAVRAQMLQHPLDIRTRAPVIFFTRMFLLLWTHHSPGGVVDLDQPFANNSKWTDRDVLLLLATAYSYSVVFKGQDIFKTVGPALDEWLSQRLPDLIGGVNDILEPMMTAHPQRLRTQLAKEFDPSLETLEKRSIVHDSKLGFVSRWIGELPLNHPMVQFMLEGLREQHSLAQTEDKPESRFPRNVLAYDTRWTQWYRTHHAIADAEIEGMLDTQLMQMWNQWYIGNPRNELGETMYYALEKGDQKIVGDFIQQRSQQVWEMDVEVLMRWRESVVVARANVHNSLLEITPRPHSSVETVLGEVEARVLHHHAVAGLTDTSQSGHRRKL